MLNTLLIQGARVIDPASGTDTVADLAVADGRILAIGAAPAGFVPEHTIAAQGCIAAPALVDLCARLREPGQEHKGMLASELGAAVAAGVGALVCPPDTDPVLDEAGLVEMLRHRAAQHGGTRVLPLGALTRGLQGEVLTEMVELTQAGCVGFSQAEVALANTQVLQRALQYAATFGYRVWLRAQDYYLGKGVAASGPLATRMGLAGVPVAAETIAIHTIIELMRSTKARVHLCRLSSAAGVALVRQAKKEGLPLSCDVSVHSLHLCDVDMGYFNSRTRLNPPLRQSADRDALRAALADGTIDALVSDHTPVAEDEKTLPFAEAEPGASAIELLLPLAWKWAQEQGVPLARMLDCVTRASADLLGDAAAQGLGRIRVGGVADLCVFDPQAHWVVGVDTLRSRSHQTPFAGYELPTRVRATVLQGRLAYCAA
ncbi:MAG: dihydroorotase [Rhodoferax sp.]